MGNERQPKPHNRQYAVPIPEGFFKQDAVRRAFQHYSAAVREDRIRFRQSNQRPKHWFEPLNSLI
jgi:hypothetical protein